MTTPHQDTLPEEGFRPAEAVVDLDALGHNLREIRNTVGEVKVLACVKGNAYGHGLIPCSKYLEQQGIDYLGVAFVDEGIALRNAGINRPILVLSGLLEQQIELALEYELDITVSSIAKLEAVETVAKRRAKRAAVHLKIDTGMERIGVHAENAEGFLDRMAATSMLDFKGISSHLACADEANEEYTQLQVERFQRVLDNPLVKEREPIRHISNSAGAVLYPNTRYDMVRCGVLLYGVQPGVSVLSSVKPVLSLQSKIVYLKLVEAGEGVSYGHRWRASERTRVVTVPVGYGDGYLRAYSPGASVLIHGKRFPIVGSVCMDQLMVNVGSEFIHNGEQVVLLGSQGDEQISATELAEIGNTVPHEVLTAINMRLPRKYLKDGLICTVLPAKTL